MSGSQVLSNRLSPAGGAGGSSPRTVTVEVEIKL